MVRGKMPTSEYSGVCVKSRPASHPQTVQSNLLPHIICLLVQFLTLRFYLHLCLPRGFFHSDTQAKNLYAFAVSSIRASANLIVLKLMTLFPRTWFLNLWVANHRGIV